MADLGPQYDAAKLQKYPHMFKLDIAIWERFLARFGDLYLGFHYDGKVGSGVADKSALKEPYTTMAHNLSRFRIDAIGLQSGLIEVLEVKPRASISAIGQVQSYVQLLREEHSTALPIIGAIVTDQEMPDMRRLTESQGINYYVV